MIIFGVLTYRNMRTLKRTAEFSNADRQLVIMVGLQVILALVATFPYGSYNVYALVTANTVKSAEHSGRDLFFVSVTTLISISHFGVSRSACPLTTKAVNFVPGKLLHLFSRFTSVPREIPATYSPSPLANQ